MDNFVETSKYNDMIDLPHHVSERHPQMDRLSRAAQFIPFAALSGYDDAIEEESRQTDERIELTEERIADINRKLFALMNDVNKHPAVRISYFEADQRKPGGAYHTVAGVIKKMFISEKIILLNNDLAIPFSDITEIEPEEQRVRP